jgi:hypothetical protein
MVVDTPLEAGTGDTNWHMKTVPTCNGSPTSVAARKESVLAKTVYHINENEEEDDDDNTVVAVVELESSSHRPRGGGGGGDPMLPLANEVLSNASSLSLLSLVSDTEEIDTTTLIDSSCLRRENEKPQPEATPSIPQHIETKCGNEVVSEDALVGTLVDSLGNNDPQHNSAVACISELLSVLGVSVEEPPSLIVPEHEPSRNTKPIPSSILQTRIPPFSPPPGQYTSNGSDSRRLNVGADMQKDEQHPIIHASAMSSATKSPVVNRRRSLFDLALYQSKEPEDVKPVSGSDNWDTAGIKKTNSACSMEGFYPRPEPGKSLLKRDTSVHSLAPSTPNSASYGAATDTGVLSSSLKRSHSSTVSFSNLEIREYNVALSDHPDCSYGPPIQLGWSYCEKQAVSVDEYELSCRSHRRTGRELLLTSPERRDLLLKEGGYTKEELQWAWEEVERVKRERQRYIAATNDLLPYCSPKTTSRHGLRGGGGSSPPPNAASPHTTNNNIGDWVGQLLSWMH